MGKPQSVLENNGYNTLWQDKKGIVVKSKEGDQYVVKEIQLPSSDNETFLSTVEMLKAINHPHIVCHQKSFQEGNCLYVLTERCLGGSLSEKMKVQGESEEAFSEEQILDWIVKLCIALEQLHNMGILHRDIRPQNIFLTEFGTICLGEFVQVSERLEKSEPPVEETMKYLAPEVLEGKTYDTKSEIWSLGCVLYELWSLNCAYTYRVKPKIMEDRSFVEKYSPELLSLLGEFLHNDPAQRPEAGDILWKPFVIRFLTKKSDRTVEELQTSLEKLRVLADGLENVHYNTTVGSLAGGVIGAAGGITSIVGLILAPFTLGASLIVTGVGVGVAVAGGATASISNITNMVNQSTDRQNIRNIMKEFQEKMNSVVACLQGVSEGLEVLWQSGSWKNEKPFVLAGNPIRVGSRVGRSLAGVPELIRLVQVTSVGKMAAQAARVAEVATGILSGFFVAIDIFFVAMDAREIHRIKKAREVPEDKNRLTLLDVDSTAEQGVGSEEPKDEGRSETMTFVTKIRETIEELQQSLEELREVISFIPKLDE